VTVNKTWRVHVAGRFNRAATESLAKSCGAFESGYAGTLYFAFRDCNEAHRFATHSEQSNPNTTIIVVNG
jgi:hypothetical protein